MIHRTKIDMSTELLIKKHRQGVKLVRPHQLTNSAENSIVEILKAPFNVYFLNIGSELQTMNDNTALNCGFQSVKNGVGKTVRAVASKESAEHLINNDKKVIERNQMILTDDNYHSLEEDFHHALSIKFPWYDEKDKIIGVFGCSIVLNLNGASSLSNAFSFLLRTGLLNSNNMAETPIPIPGKQIENNYFSRREMDVLHYLVKGNTAKQIALILGISYRTVEHHIEKAKIKMGAKSVLDLIAKVMSQK